MYIIKITSRYLSTIGFKLFALGLAVMALISYFLCVCNLNFIHLPSYLPVIISLMPVAFFNFYLLKSWFRYRKSIFLRLARCKYHRFCSIYLYYDDSPKKSEKIDINTIAENIRPCDVLLRRYEYYLDGLIFSQNSYFTHAGIFFGDYSGKKLQVIHSTGEHGVHFSSLEDFCKCDDLAILRFTTDGTEEDIETYNNIVQSDRVKGQQNDLINKELEVFQGLMEDIKHISRDKGSNHAGYENTILERAESLIGAKYDCEFNFRNFETFSCTEFVWYCFKCLFPLHRIKIRDVEFFGFLKMPVIIPDVFIKNDYFSFVYSSIPTAQNKRDLRQYVQSAHLRLIHFVLNILFWDAAMLTICYYIRPLILQTWPILRLHILYSRLF